jgi:hypothetical protein
MHPGQAEYSPIRTNSFSFETCCHTRTDSNPPLLNERPLLQGQRNPPTRPMPCIQSNPSGDVGSVLGMTGIVGGTAEDGENGHGNGLGRQHGGTPICPQQTQTNVAIGIDVFMLGNVGWQKEDRGRFRGIIGWKSNAQPKHFSLIQGSFGTLH